MTLTPSWQFLRHTSASLAGPRAFLASGAVPAAVAPFSFAVFGASACLLPGRRWPRSPGLIAAAELSGSSRRHSLMLLSGRTSGQGTGTCSAASAIQGSNFGESRSRAGLTRGSLILGARSSRVGVKSLFTNTQ